MSGKEKPRFTRIVRTISGSSENMNIQPPNNKKSPGLVYRRIPSQNSIRKINKKIPTSSPISQKMIPTSLTKARQARKKSINLGQIDSNISIPNQSQTLGRFDPNSSALNRSQNQSLYDAEKSGPPARKLSRMRGASRELIKRTQGREGHRTPENHDDSVFRSKNDESMLSNISGISRNKVRMRSRSRKAGRKRENSVKLTFTPQKRRKKSIQRVTPNKLKNRSEVKKILPKSLKRTPDRGRKGFSPSKENSVAIKSNPKGLQRRNSNQDISKPIKTEQVRQQYQSELGARTGLFKERTNNPGLSRISNQHMISRENNSQFEAPRRPSKTSKPIATRGRERTSSIKMQKINESLGISSDEGVSGYTNKINKSRDLISQKSIGSMNGDQSNSRRTSSRRYLEERQKKAWVRNSKRDSHIPKSETTKNQEQRRSYKNAPVAMGITSPEPHKSLTEIEKFIQKRPQNRKIKVDQKKYKRLQELKAKQKRYPTFGSKQSLSELNNNPNRLNINREDLQAGFDPIEVSLEQQLVKVTRPEKKEEVQSNGPSIDFLTTFQNKIKQVTSMSGKQRKRVNYNEVKKQNQKSKFSQPDNIPEKRKEQFSRPTESVLEMNNQFKQNISVNPKLEIREVEDSINQSDTTFFERHDYPESGLKKIRSQLQEEETIDYSTQHFKIQRTSGEIPKPETLTFKQESKKQINSGIRDFAHDSEILRSNSQALRNHILEKDRVGSYESQNGLAYNEMLEMGKQTYQKLQKMDSRPNVTSKRSLKFNDNPMEEEIRQLMWLNSKGDIELNEDTLRSLEKIDSQLKVVSVIGPYRSGKSFLLNRLNNSQKGFNIGNSTNPCTQGVWLWGLNEQEFSESHGETKTSTILLDTEGLFAYNRNEVFDSKLFLFTACVSSLMIYNSFGVINESAIEKFNFIINLGKHVQLANSKKKDNKKMLNSELAKLFPRLIWLLRDFTLSLTENNQKQPSDPDEYMERALLVRENWDKNSSKAQVRRCFKDVFPLRNCFTLVRPVSDEEELRNVDQVPFESLRSEFREELTKLLSFITVKAQTKRVEGKPLNGRSFVEFIRQIAHSLNEDSFPEISTVSDRVGIFERKRILSKLVKVYAKKTKSLYDVLPQSETALSEKLEIWKLEALAQAQSPWLKGDSLKELYKKAMKSFVQFDQDLYIKNVERSTAYCDVLVREILSDFEIKVKSLKENLSQIEISIDDLNQGPMNNENDFIKNMTRQSLLTDVFPRSQTFSKKDTLQSRMDKKGNIMKIKDYERNKKILIREISHEMILAEKRFFEKAKGPSRIRSFITKLSPQMNLQLVGLLKEAAFKDSMAFDEFKLQYEKLKTKCLTLDNMIMTQKKNIDQLMKENRDQKEHHQIIMREKSKQENYKWENYINKTEKMYHNLEENNSKSSFLFLEDYMLLYHGGGGKWSDRLILEIQHSMNVQTDLLKEIGKIREEFRNVTYSIHEDKENQNRINQQKMMFQEKEYLEMQHKVKIAELKESIERERREMDRQSRNKSDGYLEKIEALREHNEEMQAKLFKRDTQVRLLQQKIREEEQNKQVHIEFSQTLCNVG